MYSSFHCKVILDFHTHIKKLLFLSLFIGLIKRCTLYGSRFSPGLTLKDRCFGTEGFFALKIRLILFSFARKYLHMKKKSDKSIEVLSEEMFLQFPSLFFFSSLRKRNFMGNG